MENDRIVSLTGDSISMADQTHAVMERFNTALERHDIEGMLAEMAEDTVFENTSPAPDGTRLEGIDAMREFFTELFENNPDTRFDIEEQFVSGDRCVVRWRYDWGAGHVRGVDVIRLRDGLIAETYSYVKG
jgi:ketosteroid isomerase-like protein